MITLRYSKFLADLVTSLVLFTLIISPAMVAFNPFTGQVEAAKTAQMLQFISGGHILGFADDDRKDLHPYSFAPFEL
jgi:hypothetical protein